MRATVRTSPSRTLPSARSEKEGQRKITKPSRKRRRLGLPSRAMATDKRDDARTVRCDRRHGPRRREPLGAATCSRAREGARSRSRPATAPRAGARPRVARRHRRGGGAEAAQGCPLRPPRHRRAERGGARVATPSPSAPRPRPSSMWCSSRRSPGVRSPTPTSQQHGPRSTSTAVSCCPTTVTRTGRRTGASSCACTISTSCDSTANGRRSSSSSRATRSRISPSCDGTRPTATVMRHFASSRGWTARCGGSSGSRPGREAIALRDRLLAEHDVVSTNENELVGRHDELAVAEKALLEAAADGGAP